MPYVALCIEIPREAPEWVQVMPRGPEIKGLDGRKWSMKDPAKLIDMFKNMGLPLVIDYEHGQELKAPEGEEAPASGWIEDLELRDGEVWAKVDWTARAAKAINSREYRFLSPAFAHTPSMEILNLESVALTNKPNLVMTALNSREQGGKGWDEVSVALGVQVKTPGDVMAALNRRDEVALNRQVEAVVDQAIADARFCPAQRDFLISTCRAQGPEAFKEFADLNGGFANLSTPVKLPPLPGKSRLSDAQVAVCRAVGVSEEQFLNVKKDN
ncbi:phage protease [Aeromonas salmonicida]|uniref:phage protease n=1 Tax=Aeromonas salmonicida TaxID=645 RepID=UPI00232D0148|nr:phage protease [Aeromonas salmonicida]WCH26162.1 phage protease [Aeromonas salmonicida]